MEAVLIAEPQTPSARRAPGTRQQVQARFSNTFPWKGNGLHVGRRNKVNTECAPLMGAEDFAFMLQERPGAFIYIGNGNSAQLHNPAYDFNDEAIPARTSYWVRLAETALAG